MRATVLGGGGFVGRHLTARLLAEGHECWAPERGDPEIFARPLGAIFYCIGLTADFRSRPLETVEAHVCVLRALCERAEFESLIYLSSTRVYAGCDEAREDRALRVDPHQPEDLFNLSKLMGELLALQCGRPCRAVRLSNVLGPGMGDVNFVGSLVAEALATRQVRFRTALTSAKDYIWIDDAATGLVRIAEHGRRPVYNLASGANMTHGAIAALLAERGVRFDVADGAPVTSFPEIRVDLLADDTGFRPSPVTPRLAAWLDVELARGLGAADR